MAQKAKAGNRESELAKEGWKKQTTYDEPRLSELVAAYEEAGLEVRLEEPDEATTRECNACFAGGIGKLKTIYTRGKKGTGKQANKLTGKQVK
jgi:hypothetical protein